MGRRGNDNPIVDRSWGVRDTELLPAYLRHFSLFAFSAHQRLSVCRHGSMRGKQGLLLGYLETIGQSIVFQAPNLGQMKGRHYEGRASEYR